MKKQMSREEKKSEKKSKKNEEDERTYEKNKKYRKILKRRKGCMKRLDYVSRSIKWLHANCHIMPSNLAAK